MKDANETLLIPFAEFCKSLEIWQTSANDIRANESTQVSTSRYVFTCTFLRHKHSFCSAHLSAKRSLHHFYRQSQRNNRRSQSQQSMPCQVPHLKIFSCSKRNKITTKNVHGDYKTSITLRPPVEQCLYEENHACPHAKRRVIIKRAGVRVYTAACDYDESDWNLKESLCREGFVMFLFALCWCNVHFLVFLACA